MLRRREDEKDDNVAKDEVEEDDFAKDEVEDDDVEDDDAEEEDRSQDLGRHFARACAVEMHLDMSEEPFVLKVAGQVPEPRT